MIREALEFLCEKFTEAEGIDTQCIDGDVYTRQKLVRIPVHVDHCAPFEVHSLSMLVKMVKHELTENHVFPLIVNVTDNKVVTVSSSLDVNKDRETVINCVASIPQIPFGQEMSPEQWIIQLLTNFQQTDNCKKLQELLSSIVIDQKVEVSDNGFTQKVVAMDGAQIRRETTVQPLIKLVPARTFTECKQPEQTFLVRVSKSGGITISDASGGAFRKQCMESIEDYLSYQLEEEVKEGKVVIG